MIGEGKKLTGDQLTAQLNSIKNALGESDLETGSFTKETKQALDAITANDSNAADAESLYVNLEQALLSNRDALVANLATLPPEVKEKVTALLEREKEIKDERNEKAQLDNLLGFDRVYKQYSTPSEKSASKKKTPAQKKQEKLRRALFALQAFLPIAQQTAVAALMNDFKTAQSPQADAINLQKCMELLKSLEPKAQAIIQQTVAIRAARKEHHLSSHLGELAGILIVTEGQALPSQVKYFRQLAHRYAAQKRILEARQQQVIAEHTKAKLADSITLSTEKTNPHVLKAIVEAENKKRLEAIQKQGLDEKAQRDSQLQCRTVSHAGKASTMISDSSGQILYAQLENGVRIINKQTMDVAADILAAEHKAHEQTKNTARNYYRDFTPDKKEQVFDRKLMEKGITAEHYMVRSKQPGGKEEMSYAYEQEAGRELLAKRQAQLVKQAGTA